MFVTKAWPSRTSFGLFEEAVGGKLHESRLPVYYTVDRTILCLEKMAEINN